MTPDRNDSRTTGAAPRAGLTLLLGLALVLSAFTACGPESDSGTAGNGTPGAESDAGSGSGSASTEGAAAAGADTASGDPAPGKKKSKKRDAIDTLVATPAYPFPEDLFAFEPRLPAVIDAAWEHSPIARESLDDVVAVVGDVELTYLDLARECVLRFGTDPLKDFSRVLLSLVEGAGRGILVSDEEIESAVTEHLRTNRMRDDRGYMLRTGNTPEYLRLEMKAVLLRRAAFAADRGDDTFKEKHVVEYIVYEPAFFDRYRLGLATRYGYERFAKEAVGEVDGVPIPLDVVLSHVLSHISPIQVQISLEDLIDATLYDLDLADRGIEISEEEIDGMIGTRLEMRSGPIPWEAQIRNRGIYDENHDLSVGFVRRRMKLMLGLDRIRGPLEEVDIIRYYEANQPMIGRSAVRVQAIRIYLVDPVTLLPKGPVAQAKAQIALEKVLGELEAGGDFDKLVLKYSEDVETRRYSEVKIDGEDVVVAGNLGLTNARDGLLPDEISCAAFFVPPGEWVGPIRTKKGWEIIRTYWAREPFYFPYDDEPYTDINENGRKDDGELHEDLNGNGNWDAGRRFFAMNELRRDRGQAYLAELRSKTTIEYPQGR